MKFVFKKEKGKRYCCHKCNKQFNWNKESRRYGKMEYRTTTEQRQNEKIFCCENCFNQIIK